MSAVPTANSTGFAKHWMNANVALVNAIAKPSQEAFIHAHGHAIRAIGASYGAVQGTEWEMGQALARLITDAAARSGHIVSYPYRPGNALGAGVGTVEQCFQSPGEPNRVRERATQMQEGEDCV